jgi:hypothetical protein
VDTTFTVLNGEMSTDIFRKPINIFHHKAVIKYNHKKVTDSDIDQLIGTYSLRYVHVIEIITIHLYYKYWLIDMTTKFV